MTVQSLRDANLTGLRTCRQLTLADIFGQNISFVALKTLARLPTLLYFLPYKKYFSDRHFENNACLKNYLISFALKGHGKAHAAAHA